VVSQVSRDQQVSRQTLFRWKQKAEQALQEAFMPKQAPKPAEWEL
jgi:transposase-like protein